MQTAGGKVVAANRMKGEKGAALNSEVQIDMESDVPVQEQLRQILIDNAVRVIDLFRDWDDDGDGQVSRKELTLTLALALDLTLSPNPDPNPKQVSKKELTLALTLALTLTLNPNPRP